MHSGAREGVPGNLLTGDRMACRSRGALAVLAVTAATPVGVLELPGRPRRRGNARRHGVPS